MFLADPSITYAHMLVWWLAHLYVDFSDLIVATLF